MRTAKQLRDDAERIWWAGVRAVQPENLIPEWVQVGGGNLIIANEELQLDDLQRIVVVGAGKAGAGMAIALEQALGVALLSEKSVTGWVNVPADCMRETRSIHLHPARPAGVNEPTAAGVDGTQEILRLVESLGERDLCICLISGGGSALLPAPVTGLALADKVTLTRELSARGATIHEMNAVRRELSEVKGGGLAQRCRAGRLISLILSDVLGDDLETIASGPTVFRKPTPQAALDVLRRFELQHTPAGQTAIDLLKQTIPKRVAPRCAIANHIIGNNATAVDAAGIEAERIGYNHAMISSNAPEATAETVAANLASTAKSMRGNPRNDCLISGGEPTVELVGESARGKGGRNQQLVLAALSDIEDWRGLCLLSGGTDGEDGPTDAAGAVLNEQVAARARELQLDANDFLRRNDAYHFFHQCGGLLKTGPTNTNVCDLRVVTVSAE